MEGADIIAIDVMDLIVIWLVQILGRCNSFSFNGLTTASHQMKWNEFWVQYIYIINETCYLCDTFCNLPSFFFFFSFNWSASMLCGETFFILWTVGILFVVSCVWVPVQDKGMALLWLGSFVPALHWGTSQQFWTHFSSLGVEGKKKRACVHSKGKLSKPG